MVSHSSPSYSKYSVYLSWVGNYLRTLLIHPLWVTVPYNAIKWRGRSACAYIRGECYCSDSSTAQSLPYLDQAVVIGSVRRWPGAWAASRPRLCCCSWRWRWRPWSCSGRPGCFYPTCLQFCWCSYLGHPKLRYRHRFPFCGEWMVEKVLPSPWPHCCPSV